VNVTGDWPDFDLAEWLALRSSSPGSGQTLSEWLGPVDVRLERARLIGFEFRNLVAHLDPRPDAWRIDVTGPQAEGIVTVPVDLAKGAAIRLEMQRLMLTGAARDTADAADEPATDPRALPAFAVRANEFAWEGRRFGRLAAVLRQESPGLRLESLETESASFNTRATGTWFIDETGTNTRLNVEFASTDLAAAARDLGYHDAIDAKEARVSGRFAWPGGPGGNVMARLGGTLHLELRNGQLRNVKPGAGRMLGLMSLAQLPRRLALDFRDVTNEGLAFDTVTGDFELQAGDASTHNLLLKGSVVDIGASGRTGLAAQDYDQTIVVSGNPSGPITVAGAIAGGPVGAAGALLFSQMFKGQLEGLTRVYYRVSGPWANPKVERITASASGDLAAQPPTQEVPRP
jgi:uncharacterized protein YhdP